MDRFKPQLASLINQALNKVLDHVNEVTRDVVISPADIETPPERDLGDFAYPCFRIAKQIKKNPAELAKSIVEAIKNIKPADTEFFEIKSTGPYVNFFIQKSVLIQTILNDLLLSDAQHPYASVEKNSREKWVFEFSSPNVAKPFQIYHLRTTIVGSTLSKIAKLRGYQVTTINHLGDWGTQYGKLAIALKRYANDLPAEIALKDLVQIYVRIHQDMETDASIETQGQIAFKKLESGDPEMRAIWKKCLDISLKEFLKVYERFAVTFDHYWGESFYEPYLKPLMDDLKKSGVIVLDQGAGIVRVTNRAGNEIPPCILEKSDGASIYATRDLAAALYRKKELNFDRMSYIVGKEQMLHFEQVFGVLRAMNLPWEKSCEHIPTGLYRFKDAKMSTRKGNFITLDEIMELCETKALNLMKERLSNPEHQTVLSEDEIQTISKQVALGAIVFADLSTDPTRDLDFDVDRVISFEGETGPYLQYAHTRCLSILRKAESSGIRVKCGAELNDQTIKPILKVCEQHLCKDEEINLLKRLGRFPLVLERTLDQRKPSQLANYLIDVTKDFGAFYRECKVMNPDQVDLTQARLMLVQSVKTVLAQGLTLLGIPLPEKM